MTDSSDFTTNLKTMIAERRITAVIGSGVSRATTSNAPLWGELIESGIQRCAEFNATAEWCAFARKGLTVGSLDALLMAAELVHGKLEEQPRLEHGCANSSKTSHRTILPSYRHSQPWTCR